MRDLSACRQATVHLNGKAVLLLPEFELTDFPTDTPISRQEAEGLLRTGHADVAAAGFVEKSDGRKRFSSCLIVDGSNVHLVRKCAPHETETGMFDGSGDEPGILPLSIGKTIVFMCSDLGRYCTDERFLEKCRCSGIQVAILVSAWLHNFPKAVALMTEFARTTGAGHCLIIDRFNGLVRITTGPGSREEPK